MWSAASESAAPRSVSSSPRRSSSLGASCEAMRTRALIGPQHVAKRAFDIVASVALLGPAAIVIGIATVLVRLRSPGPAIFRQVREGKNGTRFTLYKIRTMRTDAERVVDGADEWARYRRISNDQRVVPGIGKWLRESSLDELPQ